MSAHALTVYESLRASGIDEARARRAAEAIDQETSEKIAASEEKAAAQFVSKDEYAGRMEKTPTRDEADKKFDRILAEIASVRAEMAAIRGDVRFNNRIAVGLLIVLSVLTAKIVIGL